MSNEEPEKIRPSSLRDEIERLNKNLEDKAEDSKQKPWKLPFFSRLRNRDLRTGYVTICYIGTNRAVSFAKYPIREGVIYVNDKPYVCTTKYMLNYKGKPFVILPEWSIKPFSPERDLAQAVRDKNTQMGYRLIMNYMMSDLIKDKPKMSWTTIFIGLIVIVVIGYLLSKGGIF